MNVVVYTTPTCHYCHQVKEFLSQRGVEFTEYDVSQDRAAADEMIRKSEQNAATATAKIEEKAVLEKKAQKEKIPHRFENATPADWILLMTYDRQTGNYPNDF